MPREAFFLEELGVQSSGVSVRGLYTRTKNKNKNRDVAAIISRETMFHAQVIENMFKTGIDKNVPRRKLTIVNCKCSCLKRMESRVSGVRFCLEVC
jgi:hypothetical protein